MKNFLKRFSPLILLILLMLIAYFSGLTKYLQFENLRTHKKFLQDLVDQHYFFSTSLFILLYICLVSLSIPGAVFITVLGGFLFRQPFSTFYVVIGATLGASVVFLVSKTAIGNFLKKKAGPFLKKMEKGFKKNTVSYLFFLRLVPLFPFWLVNIAPAFLGVRFWTFFWTTFLGIIPGSFVYTQAGAGLGAIFDSGEKFSLQKIFNWQIRIALIGLALFSLLPILLKKIRK